MKINTKIFSVPPYISTSWTNVSALHMKSGVLVVSLIDGETIEVPGLNAASIEHVFTTHANYLEAEEGQGQEMAMQPLKSGIIHSIRPFTEMINPNMLPDDEATFRLSIGTLGELGSVLHHNQSQSDTPEIPQEILHKIAEITKIVAPQDFVPPKPEPHCNCTHCQIARALNPHGPNVFVQQKELDLVEKEEEISDKDLHFQQWEIVQSGDQLYNVTNRLDTDEKYSVYLGHPVGCTCGKENCEHVVAVLKS